MLTMCHKERLESTIQETGYYQSPLSSYGEMYEMNNSLIAIHTTMWKSNDKKGQYVARCSFTDKTQIYTVLTTDNLIYGKSKMDCSEKCKEWYIANLHKAFLYLAEITKPEEADTYGSAIAEIVLQEMARGNIK